MAKLFKKFWPLFVIIALAIVLRVVKLQNLFYFTYDESIPAFVGRRLILWHHLPLIGGATPFGFHLAPYFYWFLASILFFGKLNPIAWGYAGALLSTITTYLIYRVGSTFQNKKLGITAAIFWAFSYLANVYDRHLWALYWGPLLSLVVILCLYKLIKGKENFIFALSAALVWGITTDPSNLIFVILTIIVFVIYKLPLTKKTVLAIVIFLLSFSPLVYFDLRHNFANTKPVLNFLKAGKNNPGFTRASFDQNFLLFPRTFTRLIYKFGDNEISKQYSYCRAYITEKFRAIPEVFVFSSSVILIGFTLWSFKRKNRNTWQVVGILVVLYLFGIQLYGTILKADIFEHYITGLFAIFLLIFAKIISHLPKKSWVLAIAFFIFFNLQKLAAAQNGLGLTEKKAAVNFTLNEVGNEPFSLESLSTCWKYSGYRYLFAAFGREPVKSYVDPNFSYLYGTTAVWDHHPKTIAAFVIHDFAPETEAFYQKYALYKSHEIKSALFGNLEVIIMDNTSGWFDEPVINSFRQPIQS